MTSLLILVIVLGLFQFESRATLLKNDSRSLKKEDIARVRTKRGTGLNDEGELNSFQELGKSPVKSVAINSATLKKKGDGEEDYDGKMRKSQNKALPVAWSIMLAQLTLYGPYLNSARTNTLSAHFRRFRYEKKTYMDIDNSNYFLLLGVNQTNVNGRLQVSKYEFSDSCDFPSPAKG